MRETMERPPARIPAGLAQMMTARDAIETLGALERMKPKPEPARAPVPFAAVLRAVAAEFDLNAAEFRTKSRTEPLATARHVVIMLGFELSALNLSEIARRLGRHHSLASKAARFIKNRMEVDKVLAFRVERVRAALRGGAK